jgi:hypothetical protein
MTGTGRLRAWFVVLLFMATAALAVGMSVERGGETHATAASAESGQHAEGEASEQANTGEEAAEPARSGGEDRLWGIDLESPVAIVGAVVLSLMVAAVVWWRPRRDVLLVGVVFCLAATVFDLREVVHQAGEQSAGLAGLAVLVALLHLGAAVAGGLAAPATRVVTTA